MAKAARILAGALFVVAANHNPLHAQHLSLTVQVRNDPGVDHETIAAAQAIVSEIYVRAGVSVVWSDANAGLTIILRPRTSIRITRRAEDALGYTPGGGEERGRLAYVLMNKVDAVAKGFGHQASVVLGAAMAHELGHLLMSKAHSTTGVMKPSFNQADFRKAATGQLRFTVEQAKRLRGRAANP